jgi:TRAP-type C4-dicarboxylate transport system permease small subunit
MRKIVSKTLEYLLLFLLVSIIGLILLQVFSRYVLEMSISGIEELARLAFVWGCFIGIGLSSVRNDHIRVEILLTKVPVRWKKTMMFVSYIMILFISAIMVIVGIRFVMNKWIFPDYSTILLYPRALFWLPVPISGAIIFPATIFSILRLREE